MIKKWFFCTILILLAASFVAAQAESAGKSSDVLVVRKMIHYANNARQDPFINLETQKVMRETVDENKVEPIPAFEERQKQHPGIRGMLVKELKLQGIIKRPDETVAFFQGADGKAHFIREGDDLFNAKVKSIQKESVIFEEYKRYVSKAVEKSLVTVDLHR